MSSSCTMSVVLVGLLCQLYSSSRSPSDSILRQIAQFLQCRGLSSPQSSMTSAHSLIGGATPGRAKANALAEILPPWQSKVVVIKLYTKIFWLHLTDATNEWPVYALAWAAVWRRHCIIRVPWSPPVVFLIYDTQFIIILGYTRLEWFSRCEWSSDGLSS